MPRTPGADRTRRIVALLGMLKPDTRIAISELAAAVGASEAELASDLETLSMCGVAPYDPGCLVPLFVDEGFVEVYGELPANLGSVRLSQAEASAVAEALQAAGFSADDELTARLLAAAASAHFDAAELERTIRTAAASHAGEVYAALAQASANGAIVRIEYSSGGTGAPHAREVEPAALFLERDAWYLVAWCRSAGAWRTFRLDRIVSAGLTGETFEPGEHGPVPDSRVAFDTSGLPTARLRFAADEPFHEREWPGSKLVAEDADGSAEAEVPYAGTAWIARRVVSRLGRVEAVAPEEVREAVSDLASALLGARTAN